MTTLARLRALATRHAGRIDAALPRFTITTRSEPTGVGGMIYDPVACLVLQGAKRVLVGERAIEYGAGQYMVVAAELAALAQISQASAEQPYIALNIALDPALISGLMLEMASLPQPVATAGFGVSEAGPTLLDAWDRYAALLDTPEEIPIMAPHREHELLFRLLMGAQGALLRQIAASNSRLSQVRRAMGWIRDRYAEPLTIEAMAAVVGMSVSVFHRHFKAVSGLTPLQYQKQVRLHEARRRMIADSVEATQVAYAVGYESASQFSREYKRLFGSPPRRDIETTRHLLAVE